MAPVRSGAKADGVDLGIERLRDAHPIHDNTVGSHFARLGLPRGLTKLGDHFLADLGREVLLHFLRDLFPGLVYLSLDYRLLIGRQGGKSDGAALNAPFEKTLEDAAEEAFSGDPFAATNARRPTLRDGSPAFAAVDASSLPGWSLEHHGSHFSRPLDSTALEKKWGFFMYSSWAEKVAFAGNSVARSTGRL